MVAGRRRRRGFLLLGGRLLTEACKLKSTKDYIIHRFHALLGLYVICHFIYRFYIYFFLFLYNKNDDDDTDDDFDDMGFRTMSYKTFLLVVFLPHLILQLSGFTFRNIPRKRHPDGNRIWPEYRWHALIFFFRCMVLMFVALFWKNKEKKTSMMTPTRTSRYFRYFLNLFIVLMSSVGADIVTKHYQQKGESSSTIRQLNAPPGVLYLMSVAQFHATVHCLLTTNNLAVQFAALTVVQTSAFGMTLRRKGVISLHQGLMLYSFVLLLGMFVILHDLQQQEQTSNTLFSKAIVLGNVSAMVRMDLGVNKYILWPTVTAILLLLTKTTWITCTTCTTTTSEELTTTSTLTLSTHGDDSLLWLSSWSLFSRISTMVLLCNAILRRQQRQKKVVGLLNHVKKD